MAMIMHKTHDIDSTNRCLNSMACEIDNAVAGGPIFEGKLRKLRDGEDASTVDLSVADYEAFLRRLAPATIYRLWCHLPLIAQRWEVMDMVRGRVTRVTRALLTGNGCSECSTTFSEERSGWVFGVPFFGHVSEPYPTNEAAKAACDAYLKERGVVFL